MNALSIFSNGWMTKLFTLLLPSIKTKEQTKYLSVTIFTDTADIADLKFNSLEIGKYYRLSGQFQMIANQASAGGRLTGTCGGVTITNVHHDQSSGGSGSVTAAGISTVFKANGAVLSFAFVETLNGQVSGDGTRNLTFLTLEELPNHEETTQWN